MGKHEVVVVGGGPSGACAAQKLAKLEINTLVVERCGPPPRAGQFWREKPCGGSANWHVWEALGYTTADIDVVRDIALKYCHGKEITGIRVFSPTDTYVIEYATRQPSHSFSVRRGYFDGWLLNRAIKAGAEVKQGFVKQVRRVQSGMEVILSSGQIIPAKLVIGADGYCSQVARSLGVKINKNVAYACSIELELDEDLPPVKEFWFGDWKSRIVGYGWVFPKHRAVNIGFGFQLPNGIPETGLDSVFRHQKKAYLDRILSTSRFAETLKSLEPKLQDRLFIKWRIPLGLRIGKMVHDGAMLVGDAAGQVYMKNGEGLYPGPIGGNLAADVAANLIRQDVPLTRKNLAIYENRYRKKLGREFLTSEIFYRSLAGNIEGLEKLIRAMSMNSHVRRLSGMFLGQDLRPVYESLTMKDKLSMLWYGNLKPL